MLYLTIISMEININCDLGEKSKHHSNKYDPDLLEIVNSANVACGYHAGDEETMSQVIEISKKNGVSIGAHPSTYNSAVRDTGSYGVRTPPRRLWCTRQRR